MSDNFGTFRETKQDFAQVTVHFDGLSAVLTGEVALCRHLADLLTKNASGTSVSEAPAAEPYEATPPADAPLPLLPRTIIKIERAVDAYMQTPAPDAEGVLRLVVSTIATGSENRAALLTGPAALISSDDDYKTVKQAIQAVARRGVYFVSSRTGRS